MTQDTAGLKLSFEYWLDKAVQWGQTTTLESQQDVCLHLPKLQEFLQQIYESLKHMNSTTAIQRFPLIGQLLGRLCWNPFVVGYDKSQKTLMWCLSCLYSNEPQNPVELKANSWILSLLCHLLSSSEWGTNEVGTGTFISALGYTSVDYYSKLIKNIVLSLLTELKGNQFNGLNIPGRVSDDYVNAVSLFCVPLITLPDVTPLLEALLTYHGGGSQEVLSSEFLEAVNETFLKKKIALSESAIISLWLRHLPSLEKATLHLFERLISTKTSSLEEVACIVKDSLLPQVSCQPAIFRIVDEIFKNALLETSGTPEVMTMIQVFTQCFVQALQKDNKQHKFPLKAYFPHHHQPLVVALLKHPFDLPAVLWSQHLKYITDMLKAVVEDKSIRSHADLFESWFLLAHFGEWIDIAVEQLLKSEDKSSDAFLWLLAFYYSPHNDKEQRTQTLVEARAVYDRLMMLFSCTTLSITDLQAAANTKTDKRQSCTRHLVRHLLLSFLLFSSGGHKIAQEFISHVILGSNSASEVFGLLTRTAYRFNQLGLKNQRTVKLVNELLQELRFMD
ncbi:Fanconi anemia group C protein isoform X1 [Pelodiscus sinensis]|uniref:Fanconi anemia group C protein isoform X1 n=2 Tax=Pelodiscus sinensis TaxID=13735 RepID=UPI000D7222D3|nr:Fanconi anemia group C protein isoform X1 [Pelodiscus sinensis]XP_025033636.1 Fanconi anemia group C protein isoform X1 [Pelodiscus sinensis]XP_025033637.1 Fanconi anemia group C protein isoform X1 [Pelodiscus sinensis]XP_025033638.1 Fanconi anemia group C protein isoform X1 [Pelodiscus sinensis]|eukprot:XP_006135957.2 Fanconi anemia group C protein isoform X1 [Pelodiscus sinensis]